MKLRQLLPNCKNLCFDTDISSITSDSRQVTAGSAFICIKGPSVDGHDFAKSAAEKGAAVIICEKDLGLSNQIIVEDTRSLFAQMCATWFGNPAKSMKIIGITGTNGKTSTTYMLKTIIEAAGHKCGLIGTIQNMIGDEVIPAKNTTPGIYELSDLFAQMRDKGCEYVLMEVSSHALDQDRVKGIDFEAAVFTNLTQDHLDYHITMDNYLEAKKKLFRMCKTAIINADDDYTERLLSGLTCKTVTYSTSSDNATYTAKNINYRADGLEYELVGYNTIRRMRIKTGGKFTVYNSMAATICAMELGFSLNDAAEALAKLEGVKGRAEVYPTGKDFTVIIDYAHTPDGLKNILRAFYGCKRGRLVALFGCGGDRDRTKRPIMGEVACGYADYVIVTSDNPRSEEPALIIEDILEGMKNTSTPYKVIENRGEAIKFAIENAQKDDIIVLAGKGHETYQILKDGTIHFDEREVIAQVLENL